MYGASATLKGVQVKHASTLCMAKKMYLDGCSTERKTKKNSRNQREKKLSKGRCNSHENPRRHLPPLCCRNRDAMQSEARNSSFWSYTITLTDGRYENVQIEGGREVTHCFGPAGLPCPRSTRIVAPCTIIERCPQWDRTEQIPTSQESEFARRCCGYGIFQTNL